MDQTERGRGGKRKHTGLLRQLNFDLIVPWILCG
jgi:hypothetical protein